MKKLINFLKSNEAILIATILSLATQLWHSVDAFVKLEPSTDKSFWIYMFGMFFSLSTSFAILVFTVRGRLKTAYFYLVVEVFINLIFYQVNGLTDTYILISTLFMCVIVPVTISIYSAEIDTKEYKEATGKETDWLNKPEYSKAVVAKMPENSITNMIGVNDDEFIKDVSDLVGYDVMAEGKQRMDLATREDLKKAWKERKNKTKAVLRKELEAILSKEKKEFFN